MDKKEHNYALKTVADDIQKMKKRRFRRSRRPSHHLLDTQLCCRTKNNWT